MRRDLKKLLVIFPFENKFFTEEGLDAVYVGNPLVETVLSRRAEPKKARRTLGIPQNAFPLVAVLPGSRKSEVKRMWPVLLSTARRLVSKYPRAEFVVPKPNGLSALDYPGLQPSDPVVFAEAPAWDARAACDLAWVKSGTSTVETSLLGTPMVVVYKVAPLSAFLAKRLLKVKNVGMVNLLDEHPCVPELLQEGFTPERLVEESARLLESAKFRNAQTAQFARIRRSLSRPAHPSEAAAAQILKLL
jgi:lipid-A-disaccharide synthase